MPEAFDPDQPHDFTPAIMRRHPDLACVIAEITVGWSRTEAMVGAFALHLRLDDPLELAADLGQMNARKRGQFLSALRDAAEHDAHDFFAAAFDPLTRMARARNDIVHSIWGVASQVDGGFVAQKVEENIRSSARGLKAYRQGAPMLEELVDLMREVGLVFYRITELEELSAEIAHYNDGLAQLIQAGYWQRPAETPGNN